jgi:hypothetical protein
MLSLKFNRKKGVSLGGLIPYLTLANWWNLDISGMIYAEKFQKLRFLSENQYDT